MKDNETKMQRKRGKMQLLRTDLTLSKPQQHQTFDFLRRWPGKALTRTFGVGRMTSTTSFAICSPSRSSLCRIGQKIRTQ
mmetsp:Transcript_86405/g.206929  ORF Transcript_86405/g.206929 Transcript_86405/m.206929 type:complete len:80 (-) Transcript_86405:97-336(-)